MILMTFLVLLVFVGLLIVFLQLKLVSKLSTFMDRKENLPRYSM